MLSADSSFPQIPQHGRYYCHTPYLTAASNSSLHLLEHFFIFLIHVGEVFSFSKLFHGAFPDIPNDVTFFRTLESYYSILHRWYPKPCLKRFLISFIRIGKPMEHWTKTYFTIIIIKTFAFPKRALLDIPLAFTCSQKHITPSTFFHCSFGDIVVLVFVSVIGKIRSVFIKFKMGPHLVHRLTQVEIGRAHV